MAQLFPWDFLAGAGNVPSRARTCSFHHFHWRDWCSCHKEVHPLAAWFSPLCFMQVALLHSEPSMPTSSVFQQVWHYQWRRERDSAHNVAQLWIWAMCRVQSYFSTLMPQEEYRSKTEVGVAKSVGWLWWSRRCQGWTLWRQQRSHVSFFQMNCLGVGDHGNKPHRIAGSCNDPSRRAFPVFCKCPKFYFSVASCCSFRHSCRFNCDHMCPLLTEQCSFMFLYPDFF